LGRALTLFRIESERFKLPTPFGRRIAERVLTMRTESGEPTGKTYRLEPGDDERVIASRLALKAWRGRASESDFNRPLDYSRHGVV
jgi:hypothetical protein